MNYLGSCKSCDFTIFATPEDLEEVEDFDGVKPGRAARVTKREAVFARCLLGHRVFPLGQVEGTYSEKHQCDSRCLNARGRKCTCSCGGANHGRGYAVIVSRVSPEVEMIHLGIPGSPKKIVGEVTVKERNVKAGKVVYKFLSKSGTAVLTWFCPKDIDPEFKVGEELTIRAKVRAHEESERWGKSTIVTYVERV